MLKLQNSDMKSTSAKVTSKLPQACGQPQSDGQTTRLIPSICETHNQCLNQHNSNIHNN